MAACIWSASAKRFSRTRSGIGSNASPGLCAGAASSSRSSLRPSRQAEPMSRTSGASCPGSRVAWRNPAKRALGDLPRVGGVAAVRLELLHGEDVVDRDDAPGLDVHVHRNLERGRVGNVAPATRSVVDTLEHEPHPVRRRPRDVLVTARERPAVAHRQQLEHQLLAGARPRREVVEVAAVLGIGGAGVREGAGKQLGASRKRCRRRGGRRGPWPRRLAAGRRRTEGPDYADFSASTGEQSATPTSRYAGPGAARWSGPRCRAPRLS